MLTEKEEPNRSNRPPIYIVSGGVGASGSQLVNTVLAQFADIQPPTFMFGNMRTEEQIDEVLGQAKKTGGLVVHTMIATDLRSRLVERARQENVLELDLMGELMEWVKVTYQKEPLGVPGLYRQLRKDHHERATAIEYSMAHDDGKDPQGWPDADIVLIGVSRAGKTPTSLYLAVLGYKVANIPIVPGIPTPPGLFELDARRVIGLAIEPGQLLHHRQQRQQHLGVQGASGYVDPEKIYEESQLARQVFRQGGFSVINVTDKPVESITDEIIRMLHRKTKSA